MQAHSINFFNLNMKKETENRTNQSNMFDRAFVTIRIGQNAKLGMQHETPLCFLAAMH